MRIARTVARETIRLEDAPVPRPATGEVLVQVRTVTLCGTDLHIYEDNYSTELPIVQGHEIVAAVAEVGVGVADWQIGDLVAVSPMRTCGCCYACGIGRMNACRRFSAYGCYEDGALTEYMTVPASQLVRVPEEVPARCASLAEPASIALQAARRGRPEKGERALVLGAGPIGLLTSLCLSDLGVDVAIADTVAERTAFARQFGVVDGFVIDPTHPFPGPEDRDRLATWTDGEGPSLVIEASGAPDSLSTAVDLVASAGRVVAVGMSDRAVSLPMRTLPAKDLDLLGSRNSQHLLGDALDVLSAHPDAADALITHRFGLEGLPDAFAVMREHGGLVGKIAIDITEENN